MQRIDEPVWSSSERRSLNRYAARWIASIVAALGSNSTSNGTVFATVSLTRPTDLTADLAVGVLGRTEIDVSQPGNQRDTLSRGKMDLPGGRGGAWPTDPYEVRSEMARPTSVDIGHICRARKRRERKPPRQDAPTQRCRPLSRRANRCSMRLGHLSGNSEIRSKVKLCSWCRRARGRIRGRRGRRPTARYVRGMRNVGSMRDVSATAAAASRNMRRMRTVRTVTKHARWHTSSMS